MRAKCKGCVCVRSSYPVVIGSIWVFIAGDDLRCHPVRCANESVPAAHGAVQLSAHAKVHWNMQAVGLANYSCHYFHSTMTYSRPQCKQSTEMYVYTVLDWWFWVNTWWYNNKPGCKPNLLQQGGQVRPNDSIRVAKEGEIKHYRKWNNVTSLFVRPAYDQHWT